MTVTLNPKRKHIKVGLWLRLLFATLVAGLCPIILLGYNALESSRIAVDRATDAATEALDNKALEALQVQASQTAQSISHLLETSVQDTMAAALLPRNAEAYLALSRLHTGELRYPGGTKQAPEERREQVPLYRELTYIDAYGQEQLRILNSQVVAPELLRNVSNPANTTYLTETYFAETSKMPRGQVYISHLTDWHASIKQQPGAILNIDEKAQRTVMGAEYGKFEAVIRFATPVFNQRGEFDGIVMLSLDARHLMEYVIHILPTSEKWTLWPDYLSGNYAYVWDDDGYLIAHPLLYRLRGLDATGKLLPSFTRNMSDEEKARNSFLMQQGNDPAPQMYQATQEGQEGLAFNYNQAGTRKANVYAPIRFSEGNYAAKGVFGGIVIGANTKEFHRAADTIGSDLEQERNELQNNTLTIIASALALLIAVVTVVSLSITRPVLRLTMATRLMQKGETHEVMLNKVLNRLFQDEVTRLALVFKQMFETVKQRENELAEYNATLEQKVEQRTTQLAKANEEITVLNERLEAENLRMSNELEITRRLQEMILPREQELERIGGLEVVGYMNPATEVGGDYYDVLQQPDGRVKIGIGDVTGHGLESGVLMIMVQTAVRTLQNHNETDPVRFLDTLNRTIYHNVQRMNSDKNLTLSLLDYQGGVLRLSGQHEEMVIVRACGEVELRDTIDLGFPIGLEEDISAFIAQTEVTLEPGDLVVLYSDGIPEAENLDGEQYGLERLCQVANANRHLPAEEIKRAVIDNLMQHIGSQKVFDDITLVVLKQKQEVRCG